MKEEDITMLAQLLNAMKDAIVKMNQFYEAKDLQNFELSKKEVLSLQSRIERIL